MSTNSLTTKALFMTTALSVTTAIGSLMLNYNDLKPAIHKANNAVVYVDTGTGSGSGFLIDKKGHIVTANHVIADLKGKPLMVEFKNKEPIEATIVGSDPKTDLAVIKVDPSKISNIPPINWEVRNKPEVGDNVFTVGSPFGIKFTSTFGMISAVDRRIPKLHDGDITSFIQYDAPTNPGNSGGPLLNNKGKVIGVVDAIISPRTPFTRPGNVGIALAINSELAKKVVDDIITTGKTVNNEIPFELESEGKTKVKISKIEPDSLAAKTGLKTGDIIKSFNSRSISVIEDFKEAAYLTKPKSENTLVVERPGIKYPLFFRLKLNEAKP